LASTKIKKKVYFLKSINISRTCRLYSAEPSEYLAITGEARVLRLIHEKTLKIGALQKLNFGTSAEQIRRERLFREKTPQR